MADLKEINSYLTNLLSPHNFRDSSLNGIQVESSQTTVSRVAVAVDAGLSIIEQAIQGKAQLLIVHHGIFWGHEQAVRGPLARKLELLLKNGCSLMAWHLPLDAHPELGNNIELARYYGLSSCAPFLKMDGAFIGFKGTLQTAAKPEYFIDLSRKMQGAKEPLFLAFGKQSIKSVGIVTGSAAFGVREAAAEGLDLYVTGEPKQDVYHLAKELGINALFAGHYATETFGVRSLGKKLEKEFNVSSWFIDEPTGI
ncbi:MAG: Nif3-like dinuclear metal center hexameric protein [Oligoflexia bacterium]|nr:Nif3-like dinuclear metal center hexameric protein [Oligoflexia bacterium]